MYRMTSEGFEVSGLTLDGVRKALAFDGITGIYLTSRVLNNGPRVFGSWTVVAM
jgi:hypothetical protein